MLDLPCQAQGKKLNLPSDDTADIRSQGIAVDNENDPDPENIIDEVTYM